MRRVGRILFPALLGLASLAPLPAHGAASTLEVTAETADRVTATDDCLQNDDDCIHVLTATVTDAGAPQSGVDISFEITSGPSDRDSPDLGVLPDASCTTTGAGTCQVSFHSSAEGTDSVRAWIEDGTPLPVEVDISEGRDEAMTEGDTDEPDVTDVVEVGWYDGVIDIEPEEATFAPSTNATFEATVLERDPTPPAVAKPLLANVDAEIEAGSPNVNRNAAGPDAECPTDATGKCSLTYAARATPGVDSIRGWIDRNDNPRAMPTATGDETTGTGYEADNTETLSAEGNDGDRSAVTDVVKANIASTPVLIAKPATQNKGLTQTAMITAILSVGTVPQNAKRIAALVVSGPNAGKAQSCDTGTGGTCTLPYSSMAAGTDTVRLWADANSDGLPDEADTAEEYETAGTTPEPDTTAVVQIVWIEPMPEPPPDDDGVDAKNQCNPARPDAGKNEIIIGTRGKNKLCGYGGRDTLRGLAGNDRLNGGSGRDIAKGGPGMDRCRAEKVFKSCER